MNLIEAPLLITWTALRLTAKWSSVKLPCQNKILEVLAVVVLLLVNMPLLLLQTLVPATTIDADLLHPTPVVLPTILLHRLLLLLITLLIAAVEETLITIKAGDPITEVVPVVVPVVLLHTIITPHPEAVLLDVPLVLVHVHHSQPQLLVVTTLFEVVVVVIATTTITIAAPTPTTILETITTITAIPNVVARLHIPPLAAAILLVPLIPRILPVPGPDPDLVPGPVPGVEGLIPFLPVLVLALHQEEDENVL
jgi:hypothetical protein